MNDLTIKKSKAEEKKLKKGKFVLVINDFYFEDSAGNLKKDLINRCNIAPINFHPGPPEYRGIGCINYALYNNSKFYGSTCHTIINEKVDNGKILDVKKFKLTNKDTIDSALKKTYKIMLIQAKSIINLLFKDPNNLKKLIENNKKFKWVKKKKTRKDLDKFYILNKNITKGELIRKIRATNTKNFKPYIIIQKNKFFLSE